MRRTYKVRVRLKDCQYSFLHDQDEGVFAYRILAFDRPEKDYSSPLFLKSLLDEADELMNSCVKSEIIDMTNKKE